MAMDETFPDLGSLDDKELKELIDQYSKEELEVSYRRRLLHGKIDILRAELVNRLRGKHAGGQEIFSGADVERLTEILAGRASARPSGRRRGITRGLALALHCPECGFVNPEGANYCQKCGALLERDASGEPTTATYRIGETGDFIAGRRRRGRRRTPRR